MATTLQIPYLNDGEVPEQQFWALDVLPDPREVSGERRIEFAVELPNGELWQDWREKVADPDGDEPTVYATFERAVVARDDLADIVEDTYGAVAYRPRVVARIVGRATGSWDAAKGAK